MLKNASIIQAYAEEPEISPEPKFIVLIKGDLSFDLAANLAS